MALSPRIFQVREARTLYMRVFATLLIGVIWPAVLVAQAPAIHFRDVGKEAGLTKAPYSSMKQHYVVETISGGVALFDCDNDGKLDILVANDATIEQARSGGVPMVTLYHQGENLKFTDITKEAGLTHKGWGMGIAIADYDNDGLPDIYVTGYGGNALYHNLGNCKFEDVTEKSGVGGGGFSAGAAWADYDRDGHLDLFVSRYVHTDLNHLPTAENPSKNFFHKGLPVENPWTMDGETDLLFHNRGDGTFEEVSKKAGVSDPAARFGLGAVWGDYNNDGWPSLLVANDTGPNFLYRNKHDGTFEDVAMLSGVALSPEGQEVGNMGVDMGDFDRDGRLDFTITNYADQPKGLYWNQGNVGFTDITYSAKIAQNSLPYVSWGTGFADFDNKGLPDLVIVSGHVYPDVDTVPKNVKYREPILLYRNKGDRTFDEIALSAGLNDGAVQSRRGLAFGDINNDGNIDMVVFNVGAPPSLFLNETKNSNHRVLFKLVGTKSNRGAVGARITVTSAARSQIEEVKAGSSYISTSDPRLHFGLAGDAMMSKVEIRWPNGNVETLQNIPADAIYVIIEGKGITETVKLAPSGSR
jgi:enediyne biosynthesis protein E4